MRWTYTLRETRGNMRSMSWPVGVWKRKDSKVPGGTLCGGSFGERARQRREPINVLIFKVGMECAQGAPRSCDRSQLDRQIRAGKRTIARPVLVAGSVRMSSAHTACGRWIHNPFPIAGIEHVPRCGEFSIVVPALSVAHVVEPHGAISHRYRSGRPAYVHAA
jgi:hypothetical protein